MRPTTLVTGATGLLGAELVSQLLEEGDPRRIVCLVRDQVPASRFLAEKMGDRVIVVRGDVRDENLVTRIINEYDVGTIYHLAAQTLVETALTCPAETLDVNVRGTWALLEAVRRVPHKVKATIVASSDKAYGTLSASEYDETHPLAGEFPYDVSKSCVDLISQSYAKTYGLNIAITRCGNFFGPGDLNESRLIPGTILSLLRNERPVVRSNGKLIRDYIFISDAAAAYRTLARHVEEKGCKGEAFNFSYGRKLNVLEIIETIRRAMGSTLEPVIEDRIKHEIRVQSLSNKKAISVLGWKPEIGLEEGLERTITWYRQQFSKPAKLKKAA